MLKDDKVRQTAFEVLLRIEKDMAYSNLALDGTLSAARQNGRDSAFCSVLVYGVSERQITLDWLLSQHLQKPVKQLRPPVITALRMGAYQLCFMDSVPDSAAVNTTVQLLKSNGCAYAAGLANAVLRKLSRMRSEEAGYKQKALEKILENENLSIRYSVPDWLAELWVNAYGYDFAEALLAASFGNGENYIRVNTTKTTRDSLIAALADEGVSALPSSALPNAAILPKGTVVHKTQAFADGLYHAQGLASQYCVAALNPQPGDRILDMCAAPGGKAFTMAQELLSYSSHIVGASIARPSVKNHTTGEQCSLLHNMPYIAALELHPHRTELIRKGAVRLGLDNISVHTADATKATTEEYGLFDIVLCDVPCSGLGTLSKKPDIRRKNKASLDNLAEIQYTVLMNASAFVHPGGTLVYSTCTLNPAENEDVCLRFLAENLNFKLDKAFLPHIPRHKVDYPFLSLFPHIHGCDGFFICKMQKTGSKRQEDG